MKASPLSAALVLLPTAFACAETIPVAFSSARYEKMFSDSPFVLATPPEKGPDPGPSWSANLYLGPVWRIVRDGVERDCAVVKSRADISGAFTLVGHEPTDGVELVKVEWADELTKTKAVIKKGTEFATLEADQTAAPAPVPQPQPRPNGGPGLPAPNGVINPLQARRPTAPGVTQPNIPRPTNPAIPQPTIPRPTAVPPAPAASYNALNQPNQNQSTQNANDRKRIRVIGSK